MADSDSPPEQTEYEKKTKDSLLPIVGLLENHRFYDAVVEISKMVGDDSLNPLISILDEKKQVVEMIERIQKEHGHYTFQQPYNEKNKSKVETRVCTDLEKDEKVWYQCCFPNDHSKEAPKKDFKLMYELLDKHPELGRKKIIQTFFFGGYFGVNPITNDDISRTGLGLALERGCKFVLSWDYIRNKPSKDARFFMYDGARNVLKYVDGERNLFMIVKKTMKTEGEEEEKIITNVTFTPFPKEGLPDSEVQKHLGSIYEVGEITGGYYRRQRSTTYGLPFPKYKFIRKRALEYDDYEDEWEDYYDDDVSHKIEVHEEEDQGGNSLFMFIPNTCLQYFRYSTSGLASILDNMISTRKIDELKKIFTHFPESIVTNVSSSAYKSWGSTPLFFSVLRSHDDELINLCISGLGEASKMLCDSMYSMKSSASGKGFSRSTPLIHQIYDSSRVDLPTLSATYVSGEEEKELGIENYEMKSQVRKAMAELDGDDSDDDDWLPKKKKKKGEKKITDPKILEIAKKYRDLKKKKFEREYELKSKMRKERNSRMKLLFYKLRHYLNWSASNSSGGYRRKSGSSFIERVIMDDNLEIAKYLIEELMVDKPDQKPIKRKLNYFHLDDLKVTGEKKVDRNRRRLGLFGKGKGKGGRPEHSRTYRYVLSRRTFWNPSNFKFFSQEYQYVVYLFQWIMEEKEWFLPQEMVCSIFQFLDFFAFEYILGNYVDTKIGQKVYVWNHPLPNFLKVNMKNYYHLVLKIKEKGREYFHGLRDQMGEMEFKSILEHILFERNEKKSTSDQETVVGNTDFFRYISDKKKDSEEGKEETEGEKEKISRRYYRSRYSGVSVSEHQGQHHHGLITLVHHLKNEIVYRMNERGEKLETFVKEIVKLQDSTYPKEAERVRSRIKYEKDNQYASRWRRPSPAKDWLSVGGGNTKYFAEPKDAPKGAKSKEHVWKKFLEFVMKLT